MARGGRIVGRIVGLDMARAGAIVGMVIVNFKTTMGAAHGEPAWLRSMVALLDGRAAATFVVLAGIGAHLGSARVRELGGDARSRARWTLARRALFLFVIGWLFFPIWPADILHYYGVYLAVGAVLLFVEDRGLVAAGVAAAAVGFGFVLVADPFQNWDPVDLSYRGLATPVGFVRNLLFDGFHPVFPWVAFYLFGMWLGRRDLRDPAVRRRAAGLALVVLLVTETAAAFVLGPRGANRPELSDESLRWLLSVEPIPPMPTYLLAGGATATLAVVVAIELGERLPPRLVEPLASTGQLALTLYVAHVLVGMGALDAVGRLEAQSLPWAVGTSLGFCVLSVGFAWVWRRRFARGPLEWVMRRLAG